MTSEISVETHPDEAISFDLGSVDLDLSSLWQPSFPGSELSRAAAGLFRPLPAWDGREGGRHRLVIGPGVLQVSRVDPAKLERRLDRAREVAFKGAEVAATDLLLEHRLELADGDLEAVALLVDAGLVSWDQLSKLGDWADHLQERIRRRDELADAAPARSSITTWSRKSRARMVRTLLGLDYSPMFAGGGVPAMLTLTYPGEWRSVAPSAAVAAKHVRALTKRFERAYGRPLVGIWKREFQRRGAPHWHILMVPPTELLNGENFKAWVSRVWSEVVGHRDPAERAKHRAAGTGVDYAEGMRQQDPRRLAVYFSKHGSFASKEYQNEAPAEWVEAGSVGRFWGVWGLEAGTAVVEVTPAEALAASRTMRRWQNANGFRSQREVGRRRWDTSTGEMRHAARCDRAACDGYCWKRKTGVWVGSRMRGQLGFIAVNDGPAFASQLSRYLGQLDGAQTSSSDN